MIIPIHVQGSEVLRKVSRDVDPTDTTIKALIANMFDTMKGADGIGLAAIQIGVDKNVFVLDMTEFEGDDEMPNNNLDLAKMAFINPQIVDFSEKSCSFKEGCLSVPGINENVTRPETITVKFMDENLEPKTMTLSGIWARAFQHEFDHLQGKLFVDSIAQIRKQLISPKLQAMSKGKFKARYRTAKK